MNRVLVLLFDLIAIFLFAVFARMAHQSDGLELSVAGILNTFWPFALGTLIAFAIWVAAKWDGWKAAPAGVTVWVVTVIVGLGIWWYNNERFPHWSFILVAAIMSAILLFGWRAIARFVRN